MKDVILAIDQGTTSSRAIVFDRTGRARGSGQQEFTQHYPANGWVEHDPAELWVSTLSSCREALRQAGIAAGDLACLGITNQRETTLIWERTTGEPIHRAIVWQDRRTSEYCQRLRGEPELETMIQQKTGLLLDPYFSATKIRWLLNQVPGARARAEAGELAFGTVDSWLLWQLTGGRVHRTDATNASRTLLFNLHSQAWDEDLLDLFEIPAALLPEVCDSGRHFGSTEPELLGAAVPITGILGDQQAAAFGQGCFSPGMAKSTYGTGCFLLVNTGEQIIQSRSRLLSTVAYRLAGRPTFAIEGSIFSAGAIVQWLRDGLGLLDSAAESEALAKAADPAQSVYLVPAFTGLGAPYWDAEARGAILGLTRDTGRREIVTAGLMAVCYQTRDLLEAIASDGERVQTLRVDGGMVVNNFLMQALADVLNVGVHRPAISETTALGAACIAGLQAGVFASTDQLARLWQVEQEWSPQRDETWRDRGYRGWLEAVQRTRTDGVTGY